MVQFVIIQCFPQVVYGIVANHEGRNCNSVKNIAQNFRVWTKLQ